MIRFGLLEFHGWRGIGRDRDLFWLHWRIGFVSVALDRVSVVDTVRELRHQVDALRRTVTDLANGEGPR